MDKPRKVLLSMMERSEDQLVFINPQGALDAPHPQHYLSLNVVLPALSQLDGLTADAVHHFRWPSMDIVIESLNPPPPTPSKSWMLHCISI
jgi:hypothetical protein